MVMRSALAGLMLMGIVLGRPAAGLAQEQSPATEVGLAVGSAATNLFYTPVKLIFATLGLVSGSMVGVMTGGSERAAYAFWVPTASGDFFFKPEHMENHADMKMIGDDYADTPSSIASGGEASGIYDAVYFSR